jgi:hypothetical protein
VAPKPYIARVAVALPATAKPHRDHGAGYAPPSGAGAAGGVKKGALLTGQTVGAYLAAHPSVLLTFRNSNGGVAAFPYPANR